MGQQILSFLVLTDEAGRRFKEAPGIRNITNEDDYDDVAEFHEKFPDQLLKDFPDDVKMYCKFMDRLGFDATRMIGNAKTPDPFEFPADDGNSTPDEQYSYLGLSTVVGESLPQGGLTLATTLTQYGQVYEQKWTDSTGQAVDDQQYYYNADGNIIADNNLSDPSLSSVTEYNALGQVTFFGQGTLSITQPTFTLTSVSGGSGLWINYSYDIYGNLSVSGTTYDANGEVSGSSNHNVTGDSSNVNGWIVSYDAWGRVVGGFTGGPFLISGQLDYFYDGLGRLVAQGQSSDDATEHGDAERTLVSYYDGSGNVIQQSYGQNGGIYSQYVWSPAGGSHLVLRDRDTDRNTSTSFWGQSNSGLDERIYALADGQGNVGAVAVQPTAGNASVVERYTYTPFGVVQVRGADWSLSPSIVSTSDNNNAIGLYGTGSAYDWTLLAGEKNYDQLLKVYQAGNGAYNPAQARTLEPNYAAYMSAMYGYNPGGVTNQGWYWTALGVVQTAATVVIGTALLATPAAPFVIAAGVAYLGYQAYEGYEENGVVGVVGHVSGVSQIYQAWDGGGVLDDDVRGAMFSGGLVQLAGFSYAAARGVYAAPNLIGYEWAIGADVDGSVVLGANRFLRPMSPTQPVVGSGNAYSVAYQMTMDLPAEPIGERWAHFEAANVALFNAMDSDPEFAATIRQMDPAIDSLRNTVEGGTVNWVWNHSAFEPGVMQYVPRVQHWASNPLWSLFHPIVNGKNIGGFKIWGGIY